MGKEGKFCIPLTIKMVSFLQIFFMNIKRAIISVYDKTNLEDLASFLFRNGVEIISTEGTNKYLEEKGIPTVKMADYIGFPEILGGRVKSIDPKLAGGILAKSNDKKHEEEMINYNIKRIDMVVGNFPTFEEIAKKTKNEESLLEYIDIGGYSLLRGCLLYTSPSPRDTR